MANKIACATHLLPMSNKRKYFNMTEFIADKYRCSPFPALNLLGFSWKKRRWFHHTGQPE